MTEAQFSKFVMGLPAHGLSKDQVAMLHKEFGPKGLKRIGFARIVQEFCQCKKAIAITDGFDIGSSSILRKLGIGEVFEVLEGPKEDAETQVSRVYGRAMRDAVTGWVSIQGNQGTPFLQSTEKPCLLAAGDAPLRENMDGESAVVRALVKGEILEIVEGPRDDAPEPEIRLHCSASKDGVAGWITVRSGAGVNATKSTNLYVCRSIIAMTDSFDLKNCKVLKKIAVGETLQVVGDQAGQQDEKRDINRLKFRSARDGKEGWVTLKGNQGTLYLEVSESHYVVGRAVPLRAEAAPGSEAVRQLEIGEALEALEPPCEEQSASKLGILVRAFSDGKSGWVVIGSGAPPVRPHTAK